MKNWLILLALLLVGCSNTPATQTNLYLLPDSLSPVAAKETSPLLLVKVDVADYLSQKGVVYRVSETELVQAKQNQWAEAVSNQINRKLIHNLRAGQTTYWPVGFNSALALDGQKQLHIQIRRFNGAYTGMAELAGEWLLIDAKGQIAASEPFQIQIPLEQEGYQALVSALAEGLEQLSEQLAGRL